MTSDASINPSLAIVCGLELSTNTDAILVTIVINHLQSQSERPLQVHNTHLGRDLELFNEAVFKLSGIL